MKRHDENDASGLFLGSEPLDGGAHERKAMGDHDGKDLGGKVPKDSGDDDSSDIEGCILPVHFEDFKNPQDPGHTLKKGQLIIQQRSIDLVGQIKARYEELRGGQTGHPTITISALLPAAIPSRTAYA